MRNWGTVVTGFYVLVVAGLVPAAHLLLFSIGQRRLGEVGWSEFDSWYSGWLPFVWIALLAGSPLVLLLVGVDTSRRRLRRRQHIAVSAAAAGLALALLTVAAAASVLAALDGDNWGHAVPWIVLASCPIAWLVWALVLWRLGERIFDPAQRIYRWFVAGSVLELLIALPSHLIVRQRQECCAPFVAAVGMATGLAILLMSLGPGVLFLYRARMRRLSPRSEWSSARSVLE
jgi:hypothetical protein